MARKEVKEEALNLVPIMNLVTILIPFLLTALKSVELAIIETKLPAISQGGPPPEDVPAKPPLSLTLALTGNGVRILANPDYLGLGEAAPAEGGATPPTVPCKSGGSCKGVDDYNWEDLNKKLVQIKEEAKKDETDTSSVILLPDKDLRYEILVKAMDISRKNIDKSADMKLLFPVVSIAGGAQ
jgi:biopolymer transport protein ExbD